MGAPRHCHLPLNESHRIFSDELTLGTAQVAFLIASFLKELHALLYSLYSGYFEDAL
jgi:hypothetical protein